MTLRLCLMLLCLTGVMGCVEPYAPPASHNTPDYLVVDGFINLSGDSASVSLSHTAALNSTEEPAAEAGSAVSIEDDAGSAFTLSEQSAGVYRAVGLSLSQAHTYRLRVRTSGGKEYSSSYVALTQSPVIDSVYWTGARDGININIDTHDPQGGSRYYKWRFVETWEYNSSYFSAYMLSNGMVIPRPSELYINTCWRTEQSTKILIGTTDRLSGDVIYRFPLQFISKESIRISKRYSILVEQQVLSEDAYTYWLSLQKSTETLGGLFDPLPSQANGNIYCVDTPSETVIGYFGGGSVETKRIYIRASELPDDLRDYQPAICEIDTIFNDDIPRTPNSTLLLSPVTAPNGATIGYTTSGSSCVDCRVWGGGVTLKPDFWE